MIQLIDGRVFQGTAKQVVQGMRSLAFNQQPSLKAYVRACVEAAADAGTEMAVALYDDDDGLCDSFVRAMLGAGLAKEVTAKEITNNESPSLTGDNTNKGDGK